MSKIEYLTLDLFIYNLADCSSNTQDYWSKLAKQLEEQLEQKGFSTKRNDKDPQRLDFWNKISTSIDGSYSLENFDDTNCLRYSCSFEQEFELSDIEYTLTQIKDLNLLGEMGNLAPGKISENGYLGRTWMISGWTVPANDPISKAKAHQAYKAIITKEDQYQNKNSAEFLGATVYEMWRGVKRWDKIEKDSHVIVVFYPEESTFAKAAAYYNAWRYLFYCRHKILWAYEQGQELRSRLLDKYNHSLIDPERFRSLSNKELQDLKSDLQKNIENVFDYIQNINLLKVQQHTVEVNERNYEKQRQAKFPNIKFLEDFSNIVKDKYQIQLEQDYDALNSGVAILENLTTTIRGMVEIEEAQLDKEQAQRDRKFDQEQAERDKKQAERRSDKFDQ
ncbi:MAG: hypothetical protein HC847_29445, partial [Hydrococcus sp. RU_2_2]|nr:hypothetical protein [Hydrococcus sp. RU_2_2]